MIALALRVVGLRAWIKSLRGGLRNFRKERDKNLRRAALILIGAAQKKFEGSRTRAEFRIAGGRKRRRTPPRPVTAPPDKLGVFEGRYRGSFGFDFVGGGRNRGVVVGPAVAYAPLHEFGIGMPKRQTLTPAVDETEDEIYDLIGATFEVLR